METSRPIPYDIVRPPEGVDARVLWVMGRDPITAPIAERLGYRPSDAEVAFVENAVRRQPEPLQYLVRIMGRSAVFQQDPKVILGVQYDAIDISGFGYQSMIERGGNVALLDITAPVSLPTPENFAQRLPMVTRVVDGKRYQEIRNTFEFSGAYMLEKARLKVAATLFFADELSKRSVHQIPFTTPIPLAIGYYNTVRNSAGKPAYFIAWRVPYEGKRLGYLQGGISMPVLQDAVNHAPHISRAIRFLHDRYELTHNQVHLGNFHIPEDEPPYLADFATLYPLSSESPAKARANDLDLLIESTATICENSFPRINIPHLLEYLFNEILFHYLGQYPSLVPPQTIRGVGPALERALERLNTRQGIPAQASWRRIKGYEKDIARMLQKSA